jgi:hypothetical protein
MDVLGNQKGELVDVGYPLFVKPAPELLGLGKDVVTDPAAWREDKLGRLGIEVPVEAEGEDGLVVSRPSPGVAPPAAWSSR